MTDLPIPSIPISWELTVDGRDASSWPRHKARARTRRLRQQRLNRKDISA